MAKCECSVLVTKGMGKITNQFEEHTDWSKHRDDLTHFTIVSHSVNQSVVVPRNKLPQNKTGKKREKKTLATNTTGMTMVRNRTRSSANLYRLRLLPPARPNNLTAAQTASWGKTCLRPTRFTHEQAPLFSICLYRASRCKTHETHSRIIITAKTRDTQH